MLATSMHVVVCSYTKITGAAWVTSSFTVVITHCTDCKNIITKPLRYFSRNNFIYSFDCHVKCWSKGATEFETNVPFFPGNYITFRFKMLWSISLLIFLCNSSKNWQNNTFSFNPTTQTKIFLVDISHQATTATSVQGIHWLAARTYQNALIESTLGLQSTAGLECIFFR